MNNVERRYYEYIQGQMRLLALSKGYGATEALAYQVGFLQAQLAQAMTRDSQTVDVFKTAVNQQGLTRPRT